MLYSPPVSSKVLVFLVLLALLSPSTLFVHSKPNVEVTKETNLRSNIFRDASNESLHVHELLEIDNYVNTAQNDGKTFVIVSTIVLGILTIGQLALFASIIFHRKRSEMKVLQPFLLASFVLLGALSTLSCCMLFVPTSDWICQLRDPFLMVSLNLIACILISRVWRINLLTESLNKLGANSRKMGKTSPLHEFLELKIMAFLSIQKRKSRGSIRQCVTLQDALRMIFFLMIPQIILQILSLTVPTLQSTMDVQLDTQSCVRSIGDWPTYIGIFFVVSTFAVLLILSTGAAKNHPKLLNETDEFQTSLGVFTLTLALMVPAYAISDSTNHKAYLLSCIYLGSFIPLQRFLVLPKVLQCWQERPTRKVSLHTTNIESSYSEASMAFNHEDQNMIDVAFETAKIYDEMGLPDKTVEVIEKCLKRWKVDSRKKRTVLIGGFTQRELDFFTPSDLEIILKLSVVKCKAIESLDPTKSDYVKTWMSILDIYENARESVNILDKTVIFTIFSGIIVHLNQATNDMDYSLENTLVRRFIDATEDHEDPAHYARALAMQANTFAKFQMYPEAVDTVEKIKSVYIFEEHSKTICETYGSDRVAQTISMSALWRFSLGMGDDAMKTCDYVVKELLPKMDLKNTFNTGELLWPVMGLLKLNGNKNAKEMLNLFYRNVIMPFHKHYGKEGKSVLKPLFRPLTTLLRLLVKEEEMKCTESSFDGKPDHTEAIESIFAIDIEKEAAWFAEEGNGVFAPFFDSICTERGWTTSMISSEVCLLLSRNLGEKNHDFSDALISKAVTLGEMAVGHSKDRVTGDIKFPVPNGINEPILKELEDMKKGQVIATNKPFDDSEPLEVKEHLVGGFWRTEEDQMKTQIEVNYHSRDKLTGNVKFPVPNGINEPILGELGDTSK